MCSLKNIWWDLIVFSCLCSNMNFVSIRLIFLSSWFCQVIFDFPFWISFRIRYFFLISLIDIIYRCEWLILHICIFVDVLSMLLNPVIFAGHNWHVLKSTPQFSINNRAICVVIHTIKLNTGIKSRPKQQSFIFIFMSQFQTCKRFIKVK